MTAGWACGATTRAARLRRTCALRVRGWTGWIFCCCGGVATQAMVAEKIKPLTLAEREEALAEIDC